MMLPITRLAQPMPHVTTISSSTIGTTNVVTSPLTTLDSCVSRHTTWLWRATAFFVTDVPTLASVAQTMTNVAASCPTALDAAVVLQRPSLRSRIPPLSGMKSVVLRLRHELQVTQAIIRLVAIDVVDMLMALKRAFEMLFHHVTMLKNAFPRRDVEANVTVLAEYASILVPHRKLLTSGAMLRAVTAAPELFVPSIIPITSQKRGAPAPWDIVATLRHEDIPEAA